LDLPPHPLESYIILAETMAKLTPSQRDTTYRFEAVYVNDFILARVENANATLLRRMAQAALLGIHSVFPPVEVTGHVAGKYRISQKKLEKGDAIMATTKEVLGFVVEGQSRTVQLPTKKADAITEELSRLLKRKSIWFKRIEKIVGKLIHACTILPTSKALLTPIYQSMATRPGMVGLGKDSEVRAAFLDLRTMIKSIPANPLMCSSLSTTYPPLWG
jgi:hypothetical protein